MFSNVLGRFEFVRRAVFSPLANEDAGEQTNDNGEADVFSLGALHHVVADND